jgi:hypothetical protein
MRNLVYVGLFCAFVLAGSIGSAQAQPIWNGFAGNAQHTALSAIASDPINGIAWQTKVDLNPNFAGNGDLYIHYGSPTITASDTVIVPVKTGLTGGFSVDAINGATGAQLWSTATNYVLPPAGWTPSYAPAITPNNTLYYPGAGGTVYSISNPDSPSATPSAPIAFYGNSNYAANASTFNSNVFIDTPISSDAAGDIYFGYRVTGTTPLGASFTSGIARIAANGTATYMSGASITGSSSIGSTVMNGAPAISPDGTKLYVAMSNVNVATGQSEYAATGDLVELNASTLQPINVVALNDPHTGNAAWLPDDGTASVMVGPDGNVYYGVLENPFPSNNDRGWMLQFSSSLTQSPTAPPGAFGWDDTASVVPASMVPSYKGSSKYLIMTKYNNYAGIGSGNGVNKLAILDPNATEVDPVTGQTVMAEVETITGPTPDAAKVAAGYPNAVREWCVDTGVVDPATDSILVNSEDGNLYRWNLATDTITQTLTLSTGVGEAYTPTLIGPNGAVYAIQDGILFSVVPEPSAGILLGGVMIILLMRRPRKLVA